MSIWGHHHHPGLQEHHKGKCAYSAWGTWCCKTPSYTFLACNTIIHTQQPNPTTSPTRWLPINYRCTDFNRKVAAIVENESVFWLSPNRVKNESPSLSCILHSSHSYILYQGMHLCALALETSNYQMAVLSELLVCGAHDVKILCDCWFNYVVITQVFVVFCSDSARCLLLPLCIDLPPVLCMFSPLSRLLPYMILQFCSDWPGRKVSTKISCFIYLKRCYW